LEGKEEKYPLPAEGPENKRKFLKPIVGGITSAELIQMVGNIRKQINDRYLIEERKLTRKQVTNLVDGRVNDKVRACWVKDLCFTIVVEFMPNGFYSIRTSGRISNSLLQSSSWT
jgi:hypothetical protein